MTKDRTEPDADAPTKKRILLIDDDPEIIDSMRYALEQAGYEVLIARDGNQGLSMIEKNRPDLVVVDMMMPKRSGFLVIEKLRRSDQRDLARQKIIMVTANEGRRHKEYAGMLGVDDYLRKPFAMPVLLSAVRKLFGHPDADVD